jgi:hypothetical protein
MVIQELFNQALTEFNRLRIENIKLRAFIETGKSLDLNNIGLQGIFRATMVFSIKVHV